MHSAVQHFTVAPVPRRAWLFLAALAILLVVGLLLYRAPLPATAWLLALLVVALVLVLPSIALRRRRISVEGGELSIAATLYSRRVHVGQLDLAHARIADLAEHTGLRPMLGNNSLGLPGVRAGYYLLRDRRRAFCLLTSWERVLVLPESTGRILLLSPDKPRELLEHLRIVAAAHPHR